MVEPHSRGGTMKNLFIFIIFFGLSAFSQTLVTVQTNFGSFDIELNDAKAPITVGNFLKYVDSGFYNFTIFHRVVKNFVIQGGGLTADMNEKETEAPIKNEAKNGLSNLKGSIGMARTEDIDSATSQFYINTKDNTGLDHKDENRYGYAVFGKVVEGYEVIERIESIPVINLGDYANVPAETVMILMVTRKTR
jgi:cyclophilin family peptidyl-prolyl cis-trans isomerase